MNAFIFDSEIYCETCAAEIIDDCRKKKIPNRRESETFPQGPYPNGGGESDYPTHCAKCHTFLENPLTDDGRKYVLENHREQSSEITLQWMTYYNMFKYCIFCDAEVGQDKNICNECLFLED